MAVVLELVLATAQVGRPEDDQLSFAAGKPAAGHQPACEVQPPQEKSAMTPEGHEQGGRPGARDPSGDGTDRPVDDADVGAGTRPGPRPHTHRSGCEVVSSTSSRRAVLMACAIRPRTTWSATSCTIMRPGSAGLVHDGATMIRLRRAIPRSSARMPTSSGVTRVMLRLPSRAR